MLIVIVRAVFSAEGPNAVQPLRDEALSEVPVCGGVPRVGRRLRGRPGLVPHEGANTPYGGIGLIAMFVGLFIMMGFVWAVIGE